MGSCLIQEKEHRTRSILDKMGIVFPATGGTLCVALQDGSGAREGVGRQEGGELG